LDTVVGSATRLCDADHVYLFLREGNHLRWKSSFGHVADVAARLKEYFLPLKVPMDIPEDQQQQIFNEFYQLAAPQPGRLAGLGLGLSIVDRLGKLLDHPIELAFRLGRGSRFSVSV